MVKLQDALSQLGPIRGTTSIIAGLLNGDALPISGKARVGESLAEARECLERNKKAQRECQSDWAWWGYQGDISYWSTVVDLLEAAEITGPDNLPDVVYDASAGVVMDMCSKQEEFGRAVLKAAKNSVR